MTLPKGKTPFVTAPNALCQIKQIALMDIKLERNVSNFIFKGVAGANTRQVKSELVASSDMESCLHTRFIVTEGNKVLLYLLA